MQFLNLLLYIESKGLEIAFMDIKCIIEAFSKQMRKVCGFGSLSLFFCLPGSKNVPITLLSVNHDFLMGMGRRGIGLKSTPRSFQSPAVKKLWEWLPALRKKHFVPVSACFSAPRQSVSFYFNLLGPWQMCWKDNTLQSHTRKQILHTKMSWKSWEEAAQQKCFLTFGSLGGMSPCEVHSLALALHEDNESHEAQANTIYNSRWWNSWVPISSKCALLGHRPFPPCPARVC